MMEGTPVSWDTCHTSCLLNNKEKGKYDGDDDPDDVDGDGDDDDDVGHGIHTMDNKQI